MSKNFDWHTDEESLWEALPDAEPQPQRPRRRRWPALLAAALLLAATAVVLMRQVRERAAENLETIRADVLASAGLWQLAAAEQDEELLGSLLSGRDASWTRTQIALLRQDLLLNRQPFGLSALPPAPLTPDSERLAITFAPDLTAAEVVTQRDYAIAVGNGLTETVTLAQTAVYRLGAQRWLYAPPDPEFWGEELAQENGRVHLTYPARDQEIAARLGRDLDARFAAMCRTLDGIDCPPGRRLALRLTDDPAALLATARLLELVAGDERWRLTLPAPSLVGLPLDEAGYQALFRGYAAQIVSAFVAHAAQYACCAQAPFYQALVDYELSRLNLRPWPVTRADYRRLLETRTTLDNLTPLWNSSNAADLQAANGWKVYTAVDFLIRRTPDVSPLEMAARLERAQSLNGWLSNLDGAQDGFTHDLEIIARLSQAWWQTAYRQTLQTTGAPPIPPPTQTLYLACSRAAARPDAQQATLYRLDPQTQRWQAALSQPGRIYTTPLLADKALHISFWNELPTTYLWRDDALTPVAPDPDVASIALGQVSPDGRFLLTYLFAPDAFKPVVQAVDLTACGDDGCDGFPLPAIPSWSPDGRYALFSDTPGLDISEVWRAHNTLLLDDDAIYTSANLHLGMMDALLTDPGAGVQELPAVGQGYAPFWLDGRTFGYVAPDGRALLSATVDNPAPTTLLSAERALETLPGAVNPAQYRIRFALADPQDARRLFVVVREGQPRGRLATVLAFDRQTGAVETVAEAGFRQGFGLGLGPNGRFLVIAGANTPEPRAEANHLLLVNDLATGAARAFLTVSSSNVWQDAYAWSRDGRWLAIALDDATLGLFAPEHDYLQLLATPEGACDAPAWVDDD